MARPVTLLVVFFVSFNLFAGVLSSTGVAGDLGIDAEGAQSEKVGGVDGERNVSSGTGEGDDLFGLYNVLAGEGVGLFNAIFPGLAMLERAGVPSFITQGILAPLFGLLTTIASISFLRGTDL